MLQTTSFPLQTETKRFDMKNLAVIVLAVSCAIPGIRCVEADDGTATCAATTWTNRASAADNIWYGVTFGNGLFVAVAVTGIGNRVMTSPDGIVWTSRTSAADNAWHSVTFGDGLFVAVAGSGSGNRVMTSPDGIVWASRASAADNDWRSVTFGNGLFVGVAFGGSVMTSNYIATSNSTVNTTATSEITTTTTSSSTVTTTTSIGDTKGGSSSKPRTIVLAALAVLAVLTSISAVAVFVLVTRNRNLATQIVHLQQEARGNRLESEQTTSNPLHQGVDSMYEDPVFGQEAIYTQAKIEEANAFLEESYETLDSGA
jgi:hypothetical protein